MDHPARNSSGRVIIVSGLPGAGKSTIAHLLAAQFERGAHIEADALQRMIVSGARWPGQEPIDEGFRQLRLRGRNACLLADSFATAGFTAVLDDIVIGDRCTEFDADLSCRDRYFVMLDPDLATLKRRNEARGKDAFHQAMDLFNVVRNETPRRGLWIDNAGHAPEETVQMVMQNMRIAAYLVEN